jgi:hypothetical protein
MEQVTLRNVSCSSEDPGHPARNICQPGAVGWISSRFCEFPVQIVCNFDKIVSVCELRILSHENKISSKIGVSVCESLHSSNWRPMGKQLIVFACVFAFPNCVCLTPLHKGGTFSLFLPPSSQDLSDWTTIPKQIFRRESYEQWK